VRNRKYGVYGIINGAILAVLTLAFLYPLWHVVMASFSEPASLVSGSGLILKPRGFSLKGYNAVFKNLNILKGYENTIFYVTAGTAMNMIFTVMGAYVLSRRNLFIKKPLMLIVTVTMYINAGLIPYFLLIKNIGLYNSRLSLIIPTLINTWNMIVLKTVFSQISRSLEESAMIDGAGDITILFRIILPVSKAAIAVMVLFYAVGHWNAWFDASIYLQDRGKFPLQLFLREILLANTTMGQSAGALNENIPYLLDELIKYCAIIVSTVPILLVYPFAQKYFVSGIMMGSLKE
jgi:putative aldouronate transport system permease protein